MKNLKPQVLVMSQCYQEANMLFQSGTDEPKKGEVKYEVWNFEVKCLQNSRQYQEHILLLAVRNCLKGLARRMLVSVGDKASLTTGSKKY